MQIKTKLFGYLWRFCSVICREFVRLFVGIQLTSLVKLLWLCGIIALPRFNLAASNQKINTMDENKEIRKQVNDLLGREISDEETQGIDSVKLLSERGGLVWKSVCFDG